MIDSYLPKDYNDYIYLYATKYILENKYFFLNTDAFKQYLTTISKDFVKDNYNIKYDTEKSSVDVYIRVTHNDMIYGISEYIFNPFNIDYAHNRKLIANGDNSVGNNDIYAIEVYNNYGFDSNFYVVVPNLTILKDVSLLETKIL